MWSIVKGQQGPNGGKGQRRQIENSKSDAWGRDGHTEDVMNVMNDWGWEDLTIKSVRILASFKRDFANIIKVSVDE